MASWGHRPHGAHGPVGSQTPRYTWPRGVTDPTVHMPPWGHRPHGAHGPVGSQTPRCTWPRGVTDPTGP
eukprot:146462-Pyramimonas_sp.AAC.1